MVRNIRHWAQNDMQNETERKILFIVNPKAGKGKAENLFHKKVRPVMHYVLGWDYKLCRTTQRGDCTRVITDMNPRDYTMICILGGDGTIHEALQGLLGRTDRTDRNACANIPLVPIPVGSGNALAVSIGVGDVDTAVCAMSSGHVQQMDVLAVTLDNIRTFSFLGIMYGALSSIDVGTEKLRWMGDFRFTIGAVRELIRMRSYRIKFAYLPFVEDQTAQAEARGTSTAFYPSSCQRIYPAGREDIASGSGPSAMTPSTSSASRGAGNVSPRQTDALDSSLLQSEVLEWYAQSTESDRGPGGWVKCENFDTRLTAVLNLPYIAKNSRFMPLAALSDGAMHMLQAPTDAASRTQMLKLFLKSEQGNHLDLPSVCHKKIRALLFSSSDPEAGLTVDGEVVSADSVSVELIPRLMKVISLPPIPQVVS